MSPVSFNPSTEYGLQIPKCVMKTETKKGQPYSKNEAPSVVRLSPLGTAATIGQPQMTDDGDCGAIGGMKICRGNRSTRRKSVSAPLCPPQIPHDQTPGSNPGRRGGKPATNRLSYGAASPRARVRLEELGRLKIQRYHWESNPQLPACSTVPQPNTLPRVRFLASTSTSFKYRAQTNDSIYNVKLPALCVQC
jgi:hypothetical protein